MEHTRAKRLCLFDLDGTLTCSHPGILLCVQRALTEMGKPLPAPENLRKFIGPPLSESFTGLVGLSEEECKEAVRRYRLHYEAEGALKNQPYDGIPQLLKALRARGDTLGVATSKPARFTEKILRHFGLWELFDTVSCAQEDLHPMTKKELIEQAMKHTGFSAEETIMVGDTRFDAAGARQAKTAFIGVLYGYGTREEMEKEGAGIFACTVEELTQKLLNEEKSISASFSC